MGPKKPLTLLVSRVLPQTEWQHGTFWPSCLFLILGREQQKQLNCQQLPNSGFRPQRLPAPAGSPHTASEVWLRSSSLPRRHNNGQGKLWPPHSVRGQRAQQPPPCCPVPLTHACALLLIPYLSRNSHKNLAFSFSLIVSHRTWKIPDRSCEASFRSEEISGHFGTVHGGRAQ